MEAWWEMARAPERRPTGRLYFPVNTFINNAIQSFWEHLLSGSCGIGAPR